MPAFEQTSRRAQRFRQIGEEGSGDHCGANPPTDDQASADDDRFRDAIQNRAQHDGRWIALRLLAGRALALSTAAPVDDPIPAKKDQRPGRDPAPDNPGSARGFDCLLDQLERDGTNQRARAESHHEPDYSGGNWFPKREERADQER